jgi:uncharacterized SAM-binding protein YcdF (DUF218 family)
VLPLHERGSRGDVNILRLLRILPTGPLRLVSPLWWLRRVGLIVILAYGLGNVADVWWTGTTERARVADAIVVLGAAQYNGTPSPALKRRLDHAANLYDRHLAKYVVVTGGRQQGDRVTEATAGANYLLRHGVPDARILREVQGTDTYSSIAATARILRKRNATRVILVSAPYHCARVRAIAREVGLDATTSPSGGSLPLSRLVREAAGMGVGRLIGFRRLAQLTN